jgi:hypothetical protein
MRAPCHAGFFVIRLISFDKLLEPGITLRAAATAKMPRAADFAGLFTFP